MENLQLRKIVTENLHFNHDSIASPSNVLRLK